MAIMAEIAHRDGVKQHVVRVLAPRFAASSRVVTLFSGVLWAFGDVLGCSLPSFLREVAS